MNSVPSLKYSYIVRTGEMASRHYQASSYAARAWEVAQRYADNSDKPDFELDFNTEQPAATQALQRNWVDTRFARFTQQISSPPSIPTSTPPPEIRQKIRLAYDDFESAPPAGLNLVV